MRILLGLSLSRKLVIDQQSRSEKYGKQDIFVGIFLPCCLFTKVNCKSPGSPEAQLRHSPGHVRRAAAAQAFEVRSIQTHPTHLVFLVVRHICRCIKLCERIFAFWDPLTQLKIVPIGFCAVYLDCQVPRCFDRLLNSTYAFDCY